MKIGSLFSGYGGLDMAVANVTGATTAWVSDIDKGACKILTHRAPDVPNLGDITGIDWATVEPVDIITGGFPCQDLSHAGKRAGLKEGTRSGLWSHMARAINELRPRLVVAENVRGLLSAPAPGDVEPCAWCVGEGSTVDLRALGVVLADLADLGYDAQWVGLRAADVGACHGRFRVFLIAHPAGHAQSLGRLGGKAQLAGTFDEPAGDSQGEVDADADLVGHERGGSARGRRAGSTDGDSRSAVERLLRRIEDFGPDAVMRQRIAEYRAVQLLPTPAVNDMGAGKTVEDWDEWTDAMKAKHGNGNGHGASLSIEAQRLLPTPTRRDYKDHEIRREPHRPDDADTLSRALADPLLPTPTATDAKASGGGYNGQDNVTLTDATVRNGRFGDYAAAIARWESVIGRPAPSPTEPTGKNGAHRLSPRFVEWMMGLPAGWVTDVPGLTRNEALKALGNGVVPQQAVAALHHMLAMEAAA